MEWIRKHNVGPKLLALLGAILLWLMLMDNGTAIIDRTVYVDVEKRGMDFLSEKERVLLENTSPRTEFVINGPANEVNAIAAAPESYFKVVVDFSKVSFSEALEYSLSVAIEHLLDLPTAVRITKLPAKEIFVVDRMVKKTVPVELKLTGNLPENYQITSQSVSPTTIELSGPSTYLAKVSRAVGELKVDGLKSDFSYDIGIAFFDGDNNSVAVADMAHTTYNPIKVTAGVTLRHDSTANLAVEFVMPDYLGKEALNTSIAPGNIAISGDPETVEKTNVVHLDNISIKAFLESDELYEQGYVEREIKLPNGIISDTNGQMAKVYIEIPGYARQKLSLDYQLIPTSEDFDIAEQEFVLTLFGPEAEVAMMTAEKLTLEPLFIVDDLEVGEQVVNYAVTCQEDGVVTLEGKIAVIINVHERTADPGTTEN